MVTSLSVNEDTLALSSAPCSSRAALHGSTLFFNLTFACRGVTPSDWLGFDSPSSLETSTEIGSGQ